MKKTIIRKKSAKKKASSAKKNSKYTCQECGFSVVVEDPCDCEDTHELVCCDEPMVCE